MSQPDQIKAELLAAIGPLLDTLLPNGKRVGNEYRGRGPDGAIWVVQLRGAKAGWYRNTGTGDGGMSLLGLIRDVVPPDSGPCRRCGGSGQFQGRGPCYACEGTGQLSTLPHKFAHRWARHFLHGDAPPPSWPAPPPVAPSPPRARDTGQRHYRAAHAFSWRNPVGQYLRGRGIVWNLLLRQPNALRYAAALWNSDEARHLPAMLAPIVNPLDANCYLGTHRTYLEQRDGAWRKAAIAKPKKVMGRARGGLILLQRGRSGRPWQDMPEDETLILAEGIENTLSLAMAMPDYRAAAYVSAGNLAALDLPTTVRSIVLCRDRDGLNTAVREARAETICHWEQEGRSVDIIEPPPGVHDVNDYIREGDQ